MSGTDSLILHFNDPRRIWQMPSELPARLEDVLPESWTVKALDAPADSSGDGTPTVTPEVLDAVREARVYMGYGIAPEILTAAHRLEWIHTGTAGVEATLTPELLSRQITLTNSAGIHAPPIGDTVVGLIHYFLRGLDIAVQSQAQRCWCDDRFHAPDAGVTELSACTVGILGYGGLGRAVSDRVGALGADVIALRRRSCDSEKSHVKVVTGRSGLQEILIHCHVVVVTLPETDQTRMLIGRPEIESMRDGAVLINVARGSILDEEALSSALVAGKLRGAALDVFDEEPLPSESPLWTTPNLLILPHSACVSEQFWSRQTDLILDNVRRFLGERTLRNEVDKDAGY